MKAHLLALTMLTFATTTYAFEKVAVEDGHFTKVNAALNNEKDMKIQSLNKLLEQQQKSYERKIVFLEEELKKSKDRLIEKSINHDKIQAMTESRFNEEAAFLKREVVAKTKTMMEYQRQLEKIKPSEDLKQLIKINTDLAVELRKSSDQMALIQLKGSALADKPDPVEVKGGRMPASVEH